MRKAVIGLSLLFSFLMLAQIAGVALAEDEEHGDGHGETDDMTVCTSTIFLLVLALIAVALIIMGFARKTEKSRK